MIQIIGVTGMPEVREGDDVASLIVEAARVAEIGIVDRDVVVVAQKIISKAEGRIVRLDSVEPSPRAREWAVAYDKDPRVVEVVLRESKRIVRMERGVLISETEQGFVCANAGVDTSNVEGGTVTLLPKDPDASAGQIHSSLERSVGVELAVIVSDTFGRPWREGLVNVALGVSGIAPLLDYRGQKDSHGRRLKVTVMAIADELASAAELVMKKSSGIPVAIIRGFDYNTSEATGRELIRATELDLFR
ncbi:MAG TPA: coenzyme F420-0:L-glutamate ligase [Blastocatellia bacterium]|jgi:coenzyme F420-0:L-glutamate ligase/coenzyme F420-1:gamma-L-glutamate ligase